jgi:hypothetical protein
MCGIDDATFSGGGPGDRTARRLARRLFEQRLDDWERTLLSRATRRLARLNATIEQVTRAHHGRVVPVDFRGQDACAARPWVFGPDVHARLNFRWAGPDYAEDLAFESRQRCNEPCGATIAFTTRYRAGVGTLVVTGTLEPNGTPHPNPAGQRALAGFFLTRVSR